MDIVGCSKLPSDEQRRIIGRLQELVRASPEYRRSQQTNQVISLPTGDGMALAFFNRLDAAVQSAIEITKSIQVESLCKIRMGVHTGPVFVMEDINHKRNISGAGINFAERVMSCGGQGHILLSENVAESLKALSTWRDKIQDVGQCRVKDGWIRVWNFVDGSIGNQMLPEKSRQNLRRRRLTISAIEAALALGMIATVAVAWKMGGKASQSAQVKASIAVLPLTDMSAGKNQEYFSDGLTEELMNGLAKIPGLRVAGRTSSFQFKGKTDDCRAIGEKLHVATLLEGSVREQDNRARIVVQLVNAADGFSLWSESFDRELTDIFAVEEEIARAVTGALKVTLLGGRTPASHKAPNPEAYDAYLHGRYFRGQPNKENLEKAVNYFEQAIKLAPDYAAAWGGLGACRMSQADLGYVPVEEGYREARSAIERALALDADLGSAHAAMGAIKMLHDWDWSGADASYQRALILEPGDTGAMLAAGLLSKDLGRLDQSISLCRKANERDPLSAGGYQNIGTAFYYAGRYEEAKAALRKALELAPEMANTHGLLGRVYLAESNPRDALSEAEQEKHPAFRLHGLALAHQALGSRTESNANLAKLIAAFQGDASYQIAEVYAFRGETDRAFEWLERAYTERDTGLSELKGDPLLKSLVRDPRYPAFLKKMRLPL